MDVNRLVCRRIDLRAPIAAFGAILIPAAVVGWEAALRALM